MKKFSLYLSVTIVFFSCSSSEFVNTATLPDTYQCTYMKDICKEAKEFERTYNSMSSEEKKEFENVMKAYRLQCNDALDACKKSGPPPEKK